MNDAREQSVAPAGTQAGDWLIMEMKRGPGRVEEGDCYHANDQCEKENARLLHHARAAPPPVRVILARWVSEQSQVDPCR